MRKVWSALTAMVVIAVLLVVWHTQSCESAKLSPQEAKSVDQMLAKLKGQDVYRLTVAGNELTEQQARALELRLQNKSNELIIHTLLLGYYFQKQFATQTARNARERHALWVIEYHPEAKIALLPEAHLDPERDALAYRKAKALWEQHVSARPKDTAILGNASGFFMIHDASRAEKLLKQAQSIEPQNPEWSKRLAQLYSLHKDDNPKDAGAKSLSELEKALSQTSQDIEKFYMLGDVAKAAFDAGDMGKAQKYAQALLDAAPKYSNDWNYGNAIHDGNVIFGRIALKSGDVISAKGYLLAAGKTPGSPQLDSFGPSMTLAKELLDRGEKETVLEYFSLCGNFWEMGKDSLQQWSTAVKAGKTPDFGGRLRY